MYDMHINPHLINIIWLDYKNIYTHDNQDLSILDIVRKSSYYEKNKWYMGGGWCAIIY